MRLAGAGSAGRPLAPPLASPLALLAVLAVQAALGTAAAQDASTAAPTQGPSSAGTAGITGPCASVVDCITHGATCERRACTCPPDAPALDAERNRCLRAAGVNESCDAHAQCQWAFDLSACVDGRCACLYDLREEQLKNGSYTCAAEGSLELGERCDTSADCGTAGAVCTQQQCRCHEDLPVTNKHDRCGKKARLHERCRFSEQCTAGLRDTECRDGRCRCTGKRVPYKYLDGEVRCLERGDKMIGDSCNETLQCGYDNALCSQTQRRQCACHPDFPISDGLDKCGLVRSINQSCTFNEECEAAVPKTECSGSVCGCRFGMAPQQANGVWSCGAPQEAPKQELHLDPAMIGVLVGMALMFIILCVVLRLFSKARWRENRTIFNTPNPRLMNVSLLRDSKLLHSGGDRRGSRASVRPPSRQPSMASLRPQSPSQSLGSRAGSRRGSRASSNASATSTKSPRSPTRPDARPDARPDGPVPPCESVTVEVQEPKA